MLFLFLSWEWTALFLLLNLFLGLVILKLILRSKRSKKPTIGFFHPYCNDGGGGERVLWMMISALRENYPEFSCVVFSGDIEANKMDILQKVKSRFGIELKENDVDFCFLRTREWLEAKKYPILTMIGQSIGSTFVVIEALSTLNPTIFYDSMGYSFTHWIAKLLGGCKVGCYVHYPTISTDMLSQVQSGKIVYNNNKLFTTFPFLRNGKIYYYLFFAMLYSLAGKAADHIFVNSSWTKSHIDSLWKKPNQTKILFPPCNTSHLSSIPFQPRNKNYIISIAQFRPEKDHALQIKALAHLLHSHPFSNHENIKNCKLIMIGSCRNTGDEQRIASLKLLAEELNIQDNIQFEINVSFDELIKWYGSAQFGIHTMWCEHFGIGIVELMASGVIVVAHNSGGPRSDIVVPNGGLTTGFLASTAEQYAEKFATLLTMDDGELLEIQKAARKQSQIFSDENFKEQFVREIKPLLTIRK